MEKSNDILAAERYEAEAEEYERRAIRTEQELSGYPRNARKARRQAMRHIEQLRGAAREATALAKSHRARG